MYSDTELKAVKFRHLPEAINPGNTRKSFHNQVPDCFILQVLVFSGIGQIALRL